MDDGPADDLSTDGDGGDKSMKLLLLKKSDVTANKEDYGMMGGGHDVMSANKFGNFGDVAVIHDGSLKDTDGVAGEREDGGERAFGSKGFDHVSVRYISFSLSSVTHMSNPFLRLIFGNELPHLMILAFHLMHCRVMHW